ncbi:UNVERIFIED_CONTAM: Linoleate 13S-lipoxygenase 2-1, chloroplastic [Sesamum calycinum]|uniref:Lipoxygenase n=1 Tax=Sesamum calycinum TaxID=2727403 RepID=A0AAW2SA91_9LAMI
MQSYLPSQTPSGLKSYRDKELGNLRGDGTGERKTSDRIYDYDVYNDLGDPDEDEDLARPVLGGPEHPYPRRCRTGRPRTKKDPLSESRSSNVYVPRDEAFSEVKQATFSAKTVYSVLHALVPQVQSSIAGDLPFPHFTAIDVLFNEGVELSNATQIGSGLASIIPRLVKAISDTGNNVLRFETPEFLDRDKFAWFRDAEFGRQTLAGVNPCTIKLVTEWPLKSKLDPEVYGPAESAITKELVEEEIGGFMTVEEAVKQKKLFILDYHDLLMPCVNKLTGSPSGSRCSSNVGNCVWLWRLAKAHVLAHDSGYHQLVSHWLRTHCCTEPYIIATNRQLSAMHPIYRLLHPHLRYTMEINALAREALINANGIIEKAFSPGKYSIELSSIAYDQLWRFDLEALPADLINRGMAVEDPTAPHGLKLIIEDYPYANDGLLIWDTIKEWVTDYVTHYYPEASLVQSDNELQAWWTEIRNSHHAAVNFGQFDFGAYFPNRPTTARTAMPTEDPNDEEKKEFLERPEQFLLNCFPTQSQATIVMAILDVLSTHSPDEEYIGEEIQPYWEEDKIIKSAFERFTGRLKEIEGIIDARNADTELKNRAGAGLVPYELLKPFSEAGVTGKGVPNSISI